MVEDLGHGGASLGYYAGGLAAAFCGAQFCSSILWGWFSDKYGRKPAVILGTLGAAVGIVTFGTARTYSQAIIGRVCSGFLSGNLGVAKSFLTEITDDSNRGQGFSYFSLAWAVGSVIAPLTGGLLCKPAEKYPSLFSESGLFGYYPYLLPCLVCVSFNLLGSLLCFVYMKETSASSALSNVASRLTRKNSAKGAYSQLTTGESDDDFEYHSDSSQTNNNEDHSMFGRVDIGNSIILTMSGTTTEGEELSYADVHTTGTSSSGDNLIRDRTPDVMERGDDKTSNDNDSDEDEEAEEMCFDCTGSCFVCSSGGGSNRQQMITNGSDEETIPLFLKLDSNLGGFGFDSVKIGILLSTSGGAVNGLGQSMAALTRAVGPALGGMLWSLSIQNDFVFFNFIATGCTLIVCLAINHQLGTSLDVKKRPRM
eukprot:gene24805-31186_t